MSKHIPVIEGGSPIRSSFLVFGSPQIGEPEIEEVVATLRSGWLGTGPKTHEFERRFAEYIGCRHAVAVNSCTAGLHLALEVAGLGPGDEVITSPLTFAATANVIVHCGARPVFVDVDRATMNLDPDRVAASITPRTRAIVPVHFAGRPCPMDDLMALAQEHGLRVIEDAAHAIEARYRDRKVGNIGHLTAFSFYVTKNLVTGEGGMVTTNREDWAEEIRLKSLHGLTKDAWKRYSAEGFQPYDVVYPGYKYNMTDLQASLGLHQLVRLEENWALRDAHWQRYNASLADLPEIITPLEEEGLKHARHLYTILLQTELLSIGRDQFVEALKAENIGTGIHFIALHLHSYYRRAYGLRRGMFPHAEFIADRTLSLPLSAKLSEQDVDDVVAAVRKLVTYYRNP